MELVFHYGIADDGKYSDSAKVSLSDFQQDPMGSLPDAYVDGYTLLDWCPQLSIAQDTLESAVEATLDSNTAALATDVHSYKDLVVRPTDSRIKAEVIGMNWKGTVGDYSVSAILYTYDATKYADIYVSKGEYTAISSSVKLSDNKYYVSFKLDGDTSAHSLALQPTYYDINDSVDVDFYAAYKDDTEDSSSDEDSSDDYTVNLYLKYSDVDGSERVYKTLGIIVGTAWADIKEAIAEEIPSRTYGYWLFTGWSGLPEYGTMVSDYSVYGQFEEIPFKIAFDWGGADNQDSLIPTTDPMEWGDVLPSISTLPIKSGSNLNSFFLVDANGKAVIKSHTELGVPLIRAEYQVLGGHTYETLPDEDIIAACKITAMWKEPVQWNNLDDLRNSIGVMPMPFATDPSATMTIKATDDDDAEVNYSTGFPDVFTIPVVDRSEENYGEINKNARVISRQMVNTLGNLGSQEQFFSQCGGYYTFDPDICNAIGGYPKTAILRYFDTRNNNLRTVYGLVDNNYWNFLTDGVDGIHWKYIDDNPSLSIYIDYSNFVDLSNILFVETGIPDLYEVQFDSWLDLFSFSFCDMTSTEHLQTEDVDAVYKVEGGSVSPAVKGTLLRDKLNGGLFTGLVGETYLDIYNAKTNTTNSIVLRNEGTMTYGASIWNYNLNRGMRYIYKQPRYVIGQGTVLLKRGDKIRIRGTYVDKVAPSFQNAALFWDTGAVHETPLTDKEVRRRYLCKHAMLYKVEWRA